jgi:hypothetical protein
MKIVKTMDYYIFEQELKEIIANYFKQKTGQEVNLCNIEVQISHEQYGNPKFKAAHINIQEDVE